MSMNNLRARKKRLGIPSAFLRKFGQKEDGSIIILTLFLLVTMLILGGMGVDFMRFESRRTMLQNTADVAVLAAAELDQDKTPASVVVDYFDKAGFSGTIVGTPSVLDTGDYKSVGVEARLEMNTFFLKFAGIKTLSAPARATAVEGVADIEVSLVVDISGSMRDAVVPRDGSASTQTKIEALRDAAKVFAFTLLTPDQSPPRYADKISLSLVPYTDQVNAGPELFAAAGIPQVHNFSHCVNFADSDFNTLALPIGSSLSQSQHFQSNPAWDTSINNFDQWTGSGYSMSVVDSPNCPQHSFERIIPLSQNYTELETAIEQLEPRGSTSIFLGTKWGAALLDPSMRDEVNALSGSGKPIDSVFAGRPANYPVEGVASATQKVMVVMTDGKNDYSNKVPANAYDTAAKRQYFADYNYRYAYYNDQFFGILGYQHRGAYGWYQEAYNPGEGDILFDNLCEIAKTAGIIVYTIAVEAKPEGQQALAKCASSASHFFDVSGDEMATVFESIAKQITELRLSL